ncbi:hypothetical protein V144x_48910 [Gimesia aquarii]|uniref:Uncharacterized protein n=1 Tax=Gimesia aquarii TaxID=2527964 RepID=A0A517W2B9_9PLAN|nr:hypothetical protein V144x_48910 [Gimesia aquarii]
MRPVVARSQQVLTLLCGERAASHRKRTSTSRTPIREPGSQRAAAHWNLEPGRIQATEVEFTIRRGGGSGGSAADRGAVVEVGRVHTTRSE